jgi:uncharacterized protein (DUF58 family)
MRQLHAGFRALTLRGKCLLAAGLTAGLVGLALHERDLLRVAALLVALPLIATGFAMRTRFRLTCSRRLDPVRLSVGNRSRVVLRIENISRLPTGLLLIEDTIPYLLGGRPRVVVDRLAPRRPVDVGYHISGEIRGRFQVGPLTVRLMDPFGMCELPRAFTNVDTLVVTPRVVSLPEIPLTGEWGGAGHSINRSVSTHGDDDVATREYRHGDDLRRIHWRTTARRGELTVRREEQPWQSRAAVLLDTRAMAHRGEGPASSLEWAISAAASISLHLARQSFDIRLVTDTGAEVSSAGLGGGFDGALLDVLAVLGLSAARTLHTGVETTRRQGGEGMVIAIVGSLDVDDAERLARLRDGERSTGIVFALDPTTWAAPVPARREATELRQDVIGMLARAGWRVVEVQQGDSIADLWAGVAGGSTAEPGGAAADQPEPLDVA